jgi:hypothetical protein
MGLSLSSMSPHIPQLRSMAYPTETHIHHQKCTPQAPYNFHATRSPHFRAPEELAIVLLLDNEVREGPLPCDLEMGIPTLSPNDLHQASSVCLYVLFPRRSPTRLDEE